MKRSVILFSCLVLTAVIVTFGFYSSSSDDFTGVPDGKNGSIVAQVDATPLWTTGANMTADATFGGGATYTRNDTVWLHALSNSPASNQHLRYNASTNTWATMAPLPLVRDRFSCAVLGNSLYVIGGGDASSVYQTSVQVYDELANTWTSGTVLPAALGWTKAVAYQDSLIYVAGGYTGSLVVSTVYLFNKNSGTWRTASPMPQARFGGGFARSGDTLVYTCGIDAAGSTVVNTTFKGVISSSDRSVITWTTGAAAPFTVFRTDAASWGCKGIILYHGSPTTAFTGSNSCASYSPGADAWTTLPNMPTATLYANTGSASLSGNVWKLIVAGGYNNAYLRNTQILTDTLCPSSGSQNYVMTLPTPGVNTNYVSIPHQSSMVGFTNLTIEAWVRPGTTTTAATVLNKGAGTFDYQLGISATTMIPFVRLQGVVATATSFVVAANVWTHIAATFDGANVKFYNNGALVSTVPLAGTPGSSTGEMRIGRGNNDPGNGNIEELRLWSVARTQGAIDSNKCRKYPSQFNNATGLKALWHFDNNLIDSVSSYNGTVNGNVTFDPLAFPLAGANCNLVGVEQVTNVVPQVYSLEQNYPNPFNPSTNIKFSIPKDGFVELKVYDILGREVAALVSDPFEAGTYNVNFDASKLSSGVYFYTLSSGDYKQTKKMLLVK